MARKFLVGGNFKMNGTQSSLISIIQNLNHAKLDPDVDAFIAPSHIHIASARNMLRRDMSVGAQNVYDKAVGPYTGEVSAPQLLDIGVEYVICGHSERRKAGESDLFVAQKVISATSTGLRVVFCCGETIEENQAGRTVEVVTKQIGSLRDAGFQNWNKIDIAYEPIWAIGTGKVASTEAAQDVHRAIRQWLKEEVNEETANQVRVIYGGSVTGKNCHDFCKMDDIDGFLVGGASLEPNFIDIINCNQ